MAKAIRDIAMLQALIGHRFNSVSLLEHALTHVSSVKGVNVRAQSYQRLEFLGDRVLGLVVAEELSAHFPHADEGELARRMAELVRRETCAEVAIQWDIGPNIRLGAGEANSGGRQRVTILADICESVIGAVFLDSDYPTVKAVIMAAWHKRMVAPAGDKRDAKTLLQEIAQGQHVGTPTYREVSRSGPAHKMVFVVAVDAPSLGTAEGRGVSKREAEQAAAQALMDELVAAAADTKSAKDN